MPSAKITTVDFQVSNDGIAANSEATESSLSEKQQLQITEQQKFQAFKNMSQYTGDIGSVIRKSDSLFCLNFGNDSRITKECFELMLHRLYGNPMDLEEAEFGNVMLETGEYFGIPEIIDNVLTAIVVKAGVDTNCDQIIDLLKYPKMYFGLDAEKLSCECAIQSDVPSSTNQLFDACMCFMLKNGWQLGAKKWDGIPIDTMVDIITKDYFFVPTEFDRALFIIKLIDRRVQANNDEAAKLKRVLNEDVILSQISSVRLFQLYTFQDVTGEHYIYESTIQAALDDASALSLAIHNSKDPDLNFLPAHSTSHSVYPYFAESIDNKTILSETPISHSTYPCELGKTEIPPCRIAFEFTGLERLNHDTAISSTSFFYAGSYYTISIKRNRLSQGLGGGLSNTISVMYLRKNSTVRTPSYSVTGGSVKAEELDGKKVYANGTDCLGKPVLYHCGKSTSTSITDVRTDGENKQHINYVKRYNLRPGIPRYIDTRPKCSVYAACYVVGSSTLKTTNLFKTFGTELYWENQLMNVPGDGSDDDFKKLGSIKMSVVIGLV
ncbi:unnamed protein product [Ambrosiozyma monospora]|uniref:Unnamed protein product n=1 Tax=Ambrosiozyma monospora TaxID=43982 RepID=A0ACB5TB30_AMBMO|nr:unnamed protein product [Ambrosiozyma monospora]